MLATVAVVVVVTVLLLAQIYDSRSAMGVEATILCNIVLLTVSLVVEVFVYR